MLPHTRRPIRIYSHRHTTTSNTSPLLTRFSSRTINVSEYRTTNLTSVTLHRQRIRPIGLARTPHVLPRRRLTRGTNRTNTTRRTSSPRSPMSISNHVRRQRPPRLIRRIQHLSIGTIRPIVKGRTLKRQTSHISIVIRVPRSVKKRIRRVTTSIRTLRLSPPAPIKPVTSNRTHIRGDHHHRPRIHPHSPITNPGIIQQPRRHISRSHFDQTRRIKVNTPSVRKSVHFP